MINPQRDALLKPSVQLCGDYISQLPKSQPINFVLYE